MKKFERTFIFVLILVLFSVACGGTSANQSAPAAAVPSAVQPTAVPVAEHQAVSSALEVPMPPQVDSLWAAPKVRGLSYHKDSVGMWIAFDPSLSLKTDFSLLQTKAGENGPVGMTFNFVFNGGTAPAVFSLTDGQEFHNGTAPVCTWNNYENGTQELFHTRRDTLYGGCLLTEIEGKTHLVLFIPNVYGDEGFTVDWAMPSQ